MMWYSQDVGDQVEFGIVGVQVLIVDGVGVQERQLFYLGQEVDEHHGGLAVVTL